VDARDKRGHDDGEANRSDRNLLACLENGRGSGPVRSRAGDLACVLHFAAGMDLNTITDVVMPRGRADLPSWQAGDAWLGGGTWLYSEPQPALRRMVDLTALAWEPIVRTRTAGNSGIEIAATCTIAGLFDFAFQSDWPAASLITSCCRSLLGSFKIWNMATVGGNICMALPAGPMISLATALDAVATIWTADGATRTCRIADFVIGPRETMLQAGELLRAITVESAALHRRYAFRKISLNPLGRSAALLIGMCNPATGGFTLTVTASTRRPVQISFAHMPDEMALGAMLAETIPDRLYYDDVHGAPEWRRHVTHHFAQEIRRELAEAPA
jgi:CO/xanthine dehydrogenase FAD-binding subunit